MATVVDLLENFLGQELRPDMPPVAPRLSPAQLEDLSAAIFMSSDVERADSDAIDASEEIVTATLPSEIGFPEIMHLGGAESYVSSIANQLLYCRRVYVFHNINPLLPALSKRPLDAFDEFLRTYAHLRPLIQRGTVVVGHWPDPKITNPVIDELNRLAAEDPALVTQVQAVAERHRLPIWMDAENLLDDYHITQAVAAAVGTSWTPRNRAMLDVHELMLGRANKSMSSNERVALRAAELFGRLELPDASRLRISDLVAIRENDAAFADFRRELTGIAREVLTEEGAGREVGGRDLAERAREKLKPRADLIADRVKAKSLRHHARDTGIGFIAGMTTAYVNDPADPAPHRKAIVTSAVSLLASILTKRTSGKDRLMYRFYSLFEKRF